MSTGRLARSVRWLPPNERFDSFPPASEALTEPNGLVAAGGDLTPQRLLAAYSRGIFPWYSEGQPILWWSPDPRAVLWPHELRISRRLRRTVAKGSFEFRVNTRFDEVVAGCAAPRSYASGTWITPAMAAAYGELHRLGFAHSFETWRGEELVGGLYGVAIGRMFFGESMFKRVTDASKVALVHAVEYLLSRRIALIDCQMASLHTASLGATNIARADFLGHVAELCAGPVLPHAWG